MRQLLGPALATLVLLTGCSTVTAGNPVAQPGGAPTTTTSAASQEDCVEVPGRMTTIDAQAQDEPTVSVPQPPGWERTSQMDSTVIRFVMVNRGLAADGYAPTVVVTLESGPGDQESPQDIIDEQVSSLETQLGATDVSAQSTTQCGFPAALVSYLAPPMSGVQERPAKVLCVVVPDGVTSHLVTVTTQTTRPDDPTYAADTELIYKGLRITLR